MKLREINFNKARSIGCIGLCIKKDDKIIDSGFIGEVLMRNTHLCDMKVVTQSTFFNEWVIEIGDGDGE